MKRRKKSYKELNFSLIAANNSFEMNPQNIFEESNNLDDIDEAHTEQEEYLENKAEIVKPYNISNLDDDFLGEYIAPPDRLEPSNFISSDKMDYYNRLLFEVLEANNLDLFIFYLEEGANIGAINIDGKTCLDIAIEQRKQNFIDFIINFLDNSKK
jgi:hypothetical protein